jgi:hypothetical protein
MSNFTLASSRNLGVHAGCHGDVYRHAITERPTCEKCGCTLRDPLEIIHPPVDFPKPRGLSYPLADLQNW